MQQQQQAASASSPFSAYADRPQMGLDVEFGSDPASGAFFQTDYKKHDDLKQMLDSNKDGLKLEAMKRIISMIARGRDASELFPAVVKNVVSKNIEVKKLVYLYLVRYAEEQQDLALLSISTFQRALKDPNQLIRASALRVLSSIRVSMIVPIVMLAIRESATDMSPYVRKTAAHAIPKLYSLDAEQKDELVTVIEKLLSDRTTLVVGSAVMAFDEVCPERVDLIHKNYRKLCNLLVDVDEWGQVIIINMLTRYARTQFADPNASERDEQNSDDAKVGDADDDNDANSSTTAESTIEGNNSTTAKKSKKKTNRKKKSQTKLPQSTTTSPSQALVKHSLDAFHIDLDHRLLLRQTKPLLQSRNASVVLAVAQLYHHVAPRQEVQLIAKALVRLLRSHKEVQSVVLTAIASMSLQRKSIFESHMKSFFVRSSDPTHIKLLKLDILTNLANAASISVILREFQTYISSSDRPFVAATIQAIGRCAASIKEVTETCLNGLVHLLSNRDEHVVAESVVVIKKLLQENAAEHSDIIAQMAKLLDFINVPAARASIIWLIGEYNEKVPKIAPDVLRKMAKTFADEEDIVKLQIVNLSVKLFLTNRQQTALMCQYIFTLARYDSNYDLRDRVRFLRQFLFPANGAKTWLSKRAVNIFLATKPAPVLESKYRERDQFQLGSLSHYINQRATGYNDLPQFPSIGSDPTLRNIDDFMPDAAITTTANIQQQHEQQPKKNANSSKHAAAVTDNAKRLVSESDKSSEYTNSNSSTDNSSADNSASDADNTPTQTTVGKLLNHKSKMNAGSGIANDNNRSAAASGTEDSASSSSDSSDSNDTDRGSDSANSSSSNSGDSNNKSNRKNNSSSRNPQSDESNKQTIQTAPKPAKSNIDLLLDLDDIPPIGPVMTPSLGGFLTPGTAFPMMSGSSALLSLSAAAAANSVELVGPSYIEFKHRELLNKLTGRGLQLNYRFTRSPHLYSAGMVSIELQFNNYFNDDINNIRMQKLPLPGGMQLCEFAPIATLQPLQTLTGILGVDFNDSTQPIEFELSTSLGAAMRLSLKPPIGELVRSVLLSESHFREQRTKLRGMNEHQCRLRIERKDKNVATIGAALSALKPKVFECINVANIGATERSQNALHFVGQTMSSKSLVLITLEGVSTAAGVEEEENVANLELLLTVNCEKMVVGSMVLNELRNALNAALKC